MYSKQYFESVKNATERADALEHIADTTEEFAGAATGMRYDRVQAGNQKGGYKNVDGILNTVAKLDATRERALDARELALSLIAEASAIIEHALEQPDADAPCLEAVYAYYILNQADSVTASEQYCDRSRIAQRRKRGLAKLEPYVPR
jgi:hypothetical protein